MMHHFTSQCHGNIKRNDKDFCEYWEEKVRHPLILPSIQPVTTPFTDKISCFFIFQCDEKEKKLSDYEIDVSVRK